MKNKVTLLLCLLMVLCLGGIMTSCGGNDSSETVHVYSFGDYIDMDLVDEFEEETGISVVLDTFDTNEEMYPVIKNGSADYDVVCASDYMIEKMIEEDMLEEVDFANVPNIENISKEYMSIASKFDENNTYAVPHTFGTMGILYNPDEVTKGSITSWNDLWDEKYSGKIVMPDSLRDTMAIALKAKGYSLNTTDEKELKEASEYLIEQKPLVYKYANDSARDLILGGSASIAVIWNGEVLYCREENPNLEYVVPEEGTETFLDCWVIPKGAANKEAAEKWMNFMAEKDVAMTNFDYLTYSIPNESVIESVKDDQVKMDILFPSEDLLKNCEALKNLGAEVDDMYSQYYKEFKAQ